MFSRKKNTISAKENNLRFMIKNNLVTILKGELTFYCNDFKMAWDDRTRNILSIYYPLCQLLFYALLLRRRAV